MTSNPTNHGDSELTKLRNSISAELYNLYYYELPDNMADAKEIVRRAANVANEALKAHTEALIARLPQPKSVLLGSAHSQTEFIDDMQCRGFNDCLTEVKAALKDSDKTKEVE